MTNRIMEQTDLEDGAPEDTEVVTPLDSWLRRELQSYYGGSGSDELPPELAELASRLEEKLRDAQGDAARDEPPDRERTSSRKGRDR